MDPMETGLRHRARRVARQISTQHRHLNPIFEVLEESIAERDGAQARAAFDRFKDAIDAHFSLEDEFFFPALHGLCPGRSGELSGLSRDHERLLGELASVDEALGRNDFDSAGRTLGVFASTLSAHETREEQLVGAINGLTRSNGGRTP